MRFILRIFAVLILLFYICMLLVPESEMILKNGTGSSSAGSRSSVSSSVNMNIVRSNSKADVSSQTVSVNTYAAAETQSAYSPDYILPGSDSREYSRQELEVLSNEELRVARNELYARHGRIFQDEQLRRWFSSKSWYHGTIASTQFDEERVFNHFEKYNRDLILLVEAGR